MMNKFLQVILVTVSVMLQSFPACSQDSRTQFPSFLKKAYFGVNAGYTHYAFSQRQLEPGYNAESVHVPHFALRVILLGYRFNDYLSAQISYMRPAGWIEYRNVNNSNSVHKVGMNIAGFTFRSSLPIAKKFSINGEAGIGIITRGGFIINNDTGVKDASFAGLLLGGGFAYKLNKNWELTAGVTWSPAHEKVRQPSTLFCSAGFNYMLRALPGEKVEKNAKSGYSFPRNMIQAGITPGTGGYGVNTFFSKTVPVFWGGDVHVENGISLQYQRNVYHGRKLFSLDWGTTFGWWRSKAGRENFFTVALFPLFRFTVSVGAWPTWRFPGGLKGLGSVNFQPFASSGRRGM
jgi:hypothetical protein